jgi:ribosomal protein S18 acetylase RimI-like enzyme
MTFEIIACDPALHGELIRQLTRQSFEGVMTRLGIWNEARHLEEPKYPDRYRMVVRAGEAVGFFAVRLEADHLYLQTIQLVDAARGEGLGTQLLAHLEQLAREHVVPQIRLRVFAENRARHLYLRLGYQTVKVEDHTWVMAKVVGPTP